MVKLLANLALAIYYKLSKGESIMMASLFACRVVEGRTEFDAVPVKLKPAVGKIIVEEFGLPEIVPVEFGGTRA